jgi:hypothetical protein
LLFFFFVFIVDLDLLLFTFFFFFTLLVFNFFDDFEGFECDLEIDLPLAFRFLRILDRDDLFVLAYCFIPRFLLTAFLIVLLNMAL